MLGWLRAVLVMGLCSVAAGLLGSAAGPSEVAVVLTCPGVWVSLVYSRVGLPVFERSEQCPPSVRKLCRPSGLLQLCSADWWSGKYAALKMCYPFPAVFLWLGGVVEGT